jgi:hypothetical protein
MHVSRAVLGFERSQDCLDPTINLRTAHYKGSNPNRLFTAIGITQPTAAIIPAKWLRRKSRLRRICLTAVLHCWTKRLTVARLLASPNANQRRKPVGKSKVRSHLLANDGCVVNNHGYHGYGESGFDSGEGALEMATTSKDGSRRANYPLVITTEVVKRCIDGLGLTT